MPNAKILIVDDNTVYVATPADTFSQTDVESVHYVDTTMQAMLYLPGIPGREFLTGLKKMGKYKEIHVIVLSGVKAPNKVERYKSMGADHYLAKPSTYDKYGQVARNIVEKMLYV